MSMNIVIVNGCEWLTWKITDEHMHGLIEWLNNNATKVLSNNDVEEEVDLSELPFGVDDFPQICDCDGVCNCQPVVPANKIHKNKIRKSNTKSKKG